MVFFSLLKSMIHPQIGGLRFNIHVQPVGFSSKSFILLFNGSIMCIV